MKKFKHILGILQFMVRLMILLYELRQPWEPRQVEYGSRVDLAPVAPGHWHGLGGLQRAPPSWVTLALK